VKVQYPNLFNIVQRKHATVAEMLISAPLNGFFQRVLVGDKLTEWHILVERLVNINLN
jgi:hypothetical protein